jgi:hypothetical protein
MLKVYLDSNDYSRFAELHKQSDAIRATFDALTKWIGEGHIEVRYSSVNVLEAAPLTQDSIGMAQRRFEAIFRLCGKNCLIDVVRLLRQEASQTAAFPVLSDAGDWNPAVYDLDIPNAESIARAMLDQAKSAASPKELKAFKSQFFDPHGRLRASARPRIVALRKGIGATFTQYPISAAALETYYAFLLGRSSQQQLIKALIASFADLKRWGEWYDACWNVADSLTRSLRDPAEKLADSVRRLAAMLKIIYSAIKSSGMQSKEIQRRFEDKSNPDAMRNLLLAQIGVATDSPRPRDAYSWETTPAFEIYSRVAMQVVRDSAMRVTMPRTTLDSDFMDCLHLCYAPFVDIFRADAYMVNVIERCKLPISTQFVGKLEDLPSVIASHPSFPSQ